MPRLTQEQIVQWAVRGLEAEKDRVDVILQELKNGVESRINRATSSSLPALRARQPMSAAARKRISLAQKKRWADSKKTSKA